MCFLSMLSKVCLVRIAFQVDLRLPTSKFPAVADSKQRATNRRTIMSGPPKTGGHSHPKFESGRIRMRSAIIAHFYVFDRAQGQERLDCLQSGFRSRQHYHLVLQWTANTL